MSTNRTVMALSGVVLFQAGVIAGALLMPMAHAEEPIVEEIPYRPASPPMLCKGFKLNVNQPEIDTTNPNTESGQWVSDREADGWVMYGVDFEVSQKSTGYPQTWVQICLYKPV